MSVEVKTPTREQFEHAEFQPPSREPMHSTPATTSPVKGLKRSLDDMDISLNQSEDAEASLSRRGSMSRKRRNLERSGSISSHSGSPFNMKRKARQRRNSEKEKIVLPSKFLNGGTITDPLNLSGPGNEELNKNTPVSSPLPLPKHKGEVKVLIPPNITDPLALNSDGGPGLVSPKMVGKKKKKHRKRKSTEMAAEAEPSEGDKPEEPARRSLSVDAAEKAASPNSKTDSLVSKLNEITDAIVSPAIPQTSPVARKRKRTSSDGSSASSSRKMSRDEGDRSTKQNKPKYRRQGSNASTANPPSGPVKFAARKAAQFMYGNYNRYYGYRNPDSDRDPRLSCMRSDWFKEKEVLDVGCNLGDVTVAIAREYHPKKIVGTDIDHNLISTAKKKLRHLSSKDLHHVTKFPASLSIVHGPMAPPSLPKTKEELYSFPNNIMFMQGNYVPTEDHLAKQEEEYDVVLFLSISKWIHLNWGDEALKRAFRRVFKQLRPGGRFILEPQSWPSYKRRNKLNATIYENYNNIQFKPDQFTEFLLSPAVGFTQCTQLEVPFNKSKGFQRPIFMYTKSAPSPCDRTTLSACSTPKVQQPLNESALDQSSEPLNEAVSEALIPSVSGTPDTSASSVSSKMSELNDIEEPVQNGICDSETE